MMRSASVGSLVAIACTGCGSTISNQVFYDDADFLNALPGTEQFDLAYPSEIDTSDCETDGTEKATFACVTVQALETGNAFVGTITALTDVIRYAAPSERGEDYRVWGPGDWIPEYPGYFLRVEMSRSPTRSAYSWSFQLASNTVGPWDTEIIHGTHYAGELDVAAGVGDLVLDFDALADVVGTQGGGLVTVSYDARDLTWFAVSTESLDAGLDETLSSDWVYQEDADGGGDLTFDAQLPVDDNPALEDLALRVRWTSFGEGRGDALIHGGDLTGSPRSASECWGSSGHLVWHEDDLGWLAETGDVAECAFEDAAFPAVETEAG